MSTAETSARFVTMKAATYLGERTDPPETKDGKPWLHDAYNVVLEFEERTFETPWKQGTGLRTKLPNGCPPSAPKRTGRNGSPEFYFRWDWVPGKPIHPKPEDVLSSLLMDASNAEETFSDWCGEYGYSDDSRKAMETYLACQDVRKRLRVFLGREKFAAAYLCDEGTERAAEVLCGAGVRPPA